MVEVFRFYSLQYYITLALVSIYQKCISYTYHILKFLDRDQLTYVKGNSYILTVPVWLTAPYAY